LKEINQRRSASKAPKPKKINSKGKCVSSIRTNDVIKKKKKEYDLGNNMNCFSKHLVDDSCFKKNRHSLFFLASISFSSKPFKP